MLNNTTYVILASLTANIIAQLLKVIIGWANGTKITLGMLFDDGGMPSAHNATLAAFATGIYMVDGFSLSFVIAFILFLLVAHDALNVRREIGIHATYLNKIMKKKVLKEDTGHSWKEVVVGVFVGLAVAVLFSYFR